MAAAELVAWSDGTIDPVVRAAIERAGIGITAVPFSIQLQEPRALMKEFSHVELDDVACMMRTLDRLEHGMGAAIERANAWATGDIAALRRLQGERVSCMQEGMGSEFAREHGFRDVDGKVRTVWLDAAERALAEHAVSFALLSMDGVLADGGYLAELARRGYRVEPPTGAEVAATPPAPASARGIPAPAVPVAASAVESRG